MVFNDVLGLLILESIGILITLLALGLILGTSFRLLRSNNIPGAKYIFYSIIGSFFGALLSGSQYLIYGDEENYIFDAIVGVYLAVAFLGGAYGFWRLGKHVIHERLEAR